MRAETTPSPEGEAIETTPESNQTVTGGLALLLGLVPMLLEIIWNGETTPVDLVDGSVKVGGAPDDDIQIEGLPQGLLALELEGEKVTVRARRSVRIGRALFPAHVARLVLPGEALQLPNEVVIKRPADPKEASRKSVDTACVAKELLVGGHDFDVQATRAATLTCLTGLDAGTAFPLAFNECIIGRAEDADIRIRDMAVSRRHARLRRNGKEVVLENLKGINGLFVNGQKLVGRRALSHGDVVELGQSMLRFQAPERAPEEQTVAVALGELTSVPGDSKTAPAHQRDGTTTEPTAPPSDAELEVDIEEAVEETAPADQPRPFDEERETQAAPAPRRRRRLPVDVVLMVAGVLVFVATFAITVSILK